MKRDEYYTMLSKIRSFIARNPGLTWAEIKEATKVPYGINHLYKFKFVRAVKENGKTVYYACHMPLYFEEGQLPHPDECLMDPV